VDQTGKSVTLIAGLHALVERIDDHGINGDLVADGQGTLDRVGR
jgi:hypothetical protein